MPRHAGVGPRAFGGELRPAALFALATLIWGSTWLAITFQLGVVAPEVSVAYRFAIASSLLFAACRVTGESLSLSARNHCFIAAQGALFFGFNYVAIYWAEQHIPSGLVAVVFSTITFASPIGMRIAFGASLHPRTLAAAALGVVGVALLFLPELALAGQGGAAATGVACAVLGTLLAAGGNLFAVRNNRAGIGILPGTAWGMLYGAGCAALSAVALGVPWAFDARPGYVLSLAYLALVGSVVAFLAYLTLLKRVGAGPSSYVAVSTPVIAMLLSTAFEGYQWDAWAGLGVALAVVGNFLALRVPPARH